ncbi:hypothetical protein [Novosphingobium sp.]|uniref:hypothetical protein n=1 Tax=Novosphingobium sp. TaxID=1874826 RepID=UPI003D0ECD4C
MIDLPHTETKSKEDRLNRAEWISAASFGLSVLLLAYVAGVDVQRLNDQDRRLSALESSETMSASKIESLLVTTMRIDTNVTALAEREREHRGGGK